MKPHLALMLAVLALTDPARGQEVRRDIPYAEPPHARGTLDIYAPSAAKGMPVLFWIHGGGWVAGDKATVMSKPKAFNDRGFVFVSTDYRLLPDVDMATIVGDVARSLRWVHDHIAEYGGDPNRIVVMGHSAGAQLAALICTDDRYLKEEGLSLEILKGCIPTDGDTFDIPAIIEVAETRCRVHGLPLPGANGHRQKFGNDPAKHRDFSAVNHLGRDKGIPPFLIVHVAGHPDTTAQAKRFAAALKKAGIPVTVYAGKDTFHTKINADIGLPNDPASPVVFDFAARAVKP